MKRPNILLILADDMGYGDFSAFNGGLSHTPALDSLIGEGTCLSQHYASSPVCNPSRATLFTGRYPHRTGSIDTLEWHGLERLALREITLSDILKRAGYATGLTGKWHLGSFDRRYHPDARGFDESVCFRGGMHDYYDWRLEYGNSIRRADGRYLTDVITDESIDFIHRHRAEPFFLHVAYNAPHRPLQAPPENVARFEKVGQFTQAVSTVYGMLNAMDHGVGRILDSLRDEGLEENTLVMFSSDNGPEFGGEGEACLTRFNCNLNGAKCTVYEGGIRVPMILRWPAGLPASAEIRDALHLADWFPTIAAIAGAQLPVGVHLDGLNIFPLLQGNSGHTEPRRFWQWNRYEPMLSCNAAMRDGDWKLVRPIIWPAMKVHDPEWLEVSMYHPEYFDSHPLIPVPQEARGGWTAPSPELYDLASDPEEKHNLAAQHPARVHNMLQALETWFEDVEAERRTINDM